MYRRRNNICHMVTCRLESIMVWLNLMLITVNRMDCLKPVLHVFGKKILKLNPSVSLYRHKVVKIRS